MSFDKSWVSSKDSMNADSQYSGIYMPFLQDFMCTAGTLICINSNLQHSSGKGCCSEMLVLDTYIINIGGYYFRFSFF